MFLAAAWDYSTSSPVWPSQRPANPLAAPTTRDLQRKVDQALRICRAKIFSLTVLTIRLKRITGQNIKELCDVIRMFQPETVLKWHRKLIPLCANVVPH